jgi:hypothetical protein
MPRQQFVAPIDWMLGDTCKDKAQVRLRIDVIEFGGADQGVNRGSAFTTGIGTREEVVAPLMQSSA